MRETAYNTLVRPQLEYASALWDPHNKKRIFQIEQGQRRAARWTVSNFDRKASVTKMVQDLGWRTLDQRRADARLCLFFKIVHGLVSPPNYIQHSNRKTRYCHMTKMAATPKYGRNPSKIFCSGTGGLISTKLGT